MQLHKRSFGGFRLRPKPPTCWDEGSSSRCSRRRRDALSCQPISPVVQQYSSTPTASRKSTETIKSTRLTIRRRTTTIQSKKIPVKKGRFRLPESGCIRNGLNIYFIPVVRSTSCPSFSRLATEGYPTYLSNIFDIVCIHLVRIGLPPLFSLNRSILYACSGFERCWLTDEQ